jgi:YesN/AraC family two-component response regulator
LRIFEQETGKKALDTNTTIALTGTAIGFLALMIIVLKHHRNAYQKGLLLLFVFSLTNSSLLSYPIKSIYQKNFNEWINQNGIEIAQKYMQSEQWNHLSLEGIAREVGFKSRTTFNKAFKGKTGLTPSEFKNS